MDHLVSIAVGTVGAEDHHQVHQLLSEVGYNLSQAHGYVSVSSQLVEEDDQPTEDGNDCPKEHLYYDEETLKKVYRAIKDMLPHDNLDAHETANTVILELQNRGILFRERAL